MSDKQSAPLISEVIKKDRTAKQAFEQNVDNLFDRNWQAACDLMSESAQAAGMTKASLVGGSLPKNCAEALQVLSESQAAVNYTARLVMGGSKIGEAKPVRENNKWLVDQELKLTYTVRELKESLPLLKFKSLLPIKAYGLR